MLEDAHAPTISTKTVLIKNLTMNSPTRYCLGVILPSAVVRSRRESAHSRLRCKGVGNGPIRSQDALGRFCRGDHEPDPQGRHHGAGGAIDPSLVAQIGGARP